MEFRGSLDETPLRDESGNPTDRSHAPAAGGRMASVLDDDSFPEIFSSRNPRDVFAGISSGAKNVGRGVALGAAALVAMPVAGAKENGAKGAAVGLAAGACSAAVLTVSGFMTGARQIAYGCINTKECVLNAMGNVKLWDPVHRQWMDFNLPREIDLLPVDDEDLFSVGRERALQKREKERMQNPSKELPAVDPKGYYELLGVSMSATSSEIKRAYAARALSLHPDKNPGNATAAQRFAEVNEAYRILSKPALRSEYDNGSTSLIPGMPAGVNPLEDMLGGDTFNEFVGRFNVFLWSNSSVSFTNTESDELQWRRTTRAAGALASMLDFYTEVGMHDKIQVLLEVPAGKRVVHFIGTQYMVSGGRYLGGVKDPVKYARGVLLSGQEGAKRRFSIAQNAASMALAVKRGTTNPATLCDLVSSLISGDVMDTVEDIVDKVLMDQSVSQQIHLQRAQTLCKLGQQMVEAAAKAPDVSPLMAAANANQGPPS